MRERELYYALSILLFFFTVSTCKPLSKIKETTSIPKTFAETFTLWHPSHSNTTTNQVDGNIYNFAKITGRSEYIHQRKVFRKVISDVNDTATYYCVPYCVKDTEPCCVNIGGKYVYPYATSMFILPLS